jgi:hypothetical protein
LSANAVEEGVCDRSEFRNRPKHLVVPRFTYHFTNLSVRGIFKTRTLKNNNRLSIGIPTHTECRRTNGSKNWESPTRGLLFRDMSDAFSLLSRHFMGRLGVTNS